MKAISLALFLCVLAQIPAPAQESAATPPAADKVFGDNISDEVGPAPSNATPTPDADIPLMSGTLTTIIPVIRAPGNTISLQTSPNVQATFRLAMVYVVVALDGKLVDPSAVTIGSSVMVHFLRDRDQLIIDRIFLQ